MNGKIVGIVIVGSALLAGAAIYWLQLYAFYAPVQVAAGQEITLTPIASGTPEPIVVDSFDAIDAGSSPLRYRACLTTPLSLAMLTETYTVYEKPQPLLAPPWFKCFDAGVIEAALQSGEAIAFLSHADVKPGVDRVVAVFPDGRAFAWHQFNDTYKE